jgi:hypothetical protein
MQKAQSKVAIIAGLLFWILFVAFSPTSAFFSSLSLLHREAGVILQVKMISNMIWLSLLTGMNCPNTWRKSQDYPITVMIRLPVFRMKKPISTF